VVGRPQCQRRDRQRGVDRTAGHEDAAGDDPQVRDVVGAESGVNDALRGVGTYSRRSHVVTAERRRFYVRARDRAASRPDDPLADLEGALQRRPRVRFDPQ
jgi:hypothetical protein